MRETGVTGLRGIRVWVCAAFLLTGAAPAMAQLTPITDGSQSLVTDAMLSIDPAIKNAMLTLPDAVSKWRDCYRGCMAPPNECTARICAHDCEGQVAAMGYSASQTGEILRYNVMGIYGADCIGNFRQYIQTIQDAAKAAHLTGLSAMNALASVIVDRILDAVISQILNNLTNQICNVTNQITQAANSFVQNAICVPNVSLNPFNFNLNIPNLRCDGFSINPLTGQINGNPVNGVNTGINNIYGNGSGAVENPIVLTPITQDKPLTGGPIGPITIDPITLPQSSGEQQ